MKLYLTSAYKTHGWLDHLRELAGKDRLGRHQLCSDPESADAILFVENAQFADYTYRRVKRHPLTQQFREKTFIYNEVDKPFGGLPGLYCSMPSARFRSQHQIAFPYLSLPNSYVKHIHKWKVQQDWSFSFVGSISHRLRKRIVALQPHSRGVRNTSEFNVWNATAQERASQGMLFAEAMARSRFVLCPRGIGTSSFRQFEAMQAARAPVIISDKWVAPSQTDWDFAIRVEERNIEAIPDILAEHASEALDRGQAARKVWENVYAPDVLFDTAAGAIATLLKRRAAQNTSENALRQLLPVQKWATELEVAARTTLETYRQASLTDY